MSGVSRRLLWAATCLAALCVATVQQQNSTVTPTPNVTEPSTVTSQPTPTTLTPTTLPGGRPPHARTRGGPAQHGRLARRDGRGAKATGELGRGAHPARPALPAETPSPGALLGTATWLASAVAVRSRRAKRRAPKSARSANFGSRGCPPLEASPEVESRDRGRRET